MDELKEQLARIEAYTLLGAKEILTPEEACVYTGYSKHTLYRMTSHREIPHYKIKGGLRFKKTELDSWMTQTRVETVEESASRVATDLTLRRLKMKK